MSKCMLRRVREDRSVTVYTEHTDRIHPQDLSDGLARKVGKDRFRVSLRKNIYIIYVNATEHESSNKQDTQSDDGDEQAKHAIEPPTYQQRLADFKMAEKILCAPRLPYQ
ncbi:hypothetical protein ACET3X_006381 [Alternaria dauci]|uniref:Uncharacterized protein n=1 Tax=Alternaria dauci TaxID=48095 RepID=A0ABR3UDJ0_9PLEO